MFDRPIERPMVHKPAQWLSYARPTGPRTSIQPLRRYYSGARLYHDTKTRAYAVTLVDRYQQDPPHDLFLGATLAGQLTFYQAEVTTYDPQPIQREANPLWAEQYTFTVPGIHWIYDLHIEESQTARLSDIHGLVLVSGMQQVDAPALVNYVLGTSLFCLLGGSPVSRYCTELANRRRTGRRGPPSQSGFPQGAPADKQQGSLLATA